MAPCESCGSAGHEDRRQLGRNEGLEVAGIYRGGIILSCCTSLIKTRSDQTR